MTIVVCVRMTDGIVLASDSATSFINPQSGGVLKVYNHADKVFNLVKPHPIGAMTYGSGSIGAASISTLTKDLRRRLQSKDPGEPCRIDLAAYTVEEVAVKARDFFSSAYKEAHPDGIANFLMGYRVCGYSSGGHLPEAWEIGIKGDAPFGPTALYDLNHSNDFGPRWAGETEALDRLILGVGSRMGDALKAQGLDDAASQRVSVALVAALRVNLHLAAMPIQDAIDLARFLAETAARFAYFSLRAPTVGGPSNSPPSPSTKGSSG